MTDVVRTHRETALESPYSRDRESAIEELAAVYEDVDAEGRREILETFREVVLESSNRSERELAREKLLSCFEADPSTAAEVAVGTFAAVATDATFSGERESAIDVLRRLHREAPNERERIEETLESIAEEATREDERERARRRLSDLASDADGTGGSNETGDGDYLGVSLAEHLAAAADESPAACRRRAAELRDFVADEQVASDSYREVREDLDALVDQLEVVPTDGDLDADRKERVRDVADRVERLYGRQ
ncbi:MAG: hypothetical protein ABEI96_07015 [Haloarculaceae archaeon]